MTVRKAIILAAGYGTRFLPATKVIPKEMLPIVDRPVIQFIVEEALAAGLDQLVIVTSSPKRAVEDHFDREWDLESTLEQKGAFERLEEVRRLAEMTDMAFMRQKERKGIAHAVLSTRQFLGDEPFALFFPDDVIFSEEPAIGQLLAVRERHGGSVLAVQDLPKEEVVHYGVIDSEPVEDRVHRVRSIVEKPPVHEAPSTLATVGRYVLSEEIWPLLEKTQPGLGGEVQLTDTLEMLAREGGPLFACEYEGDRFDTGRPLGLLKASLYLGLRRDAMADELRQYMKGSLEVS